MNFKTLLIVLSLGFLFISCNKDIKKVSKLETQKDSLSYAVGLITSQQVKFSFDNNIDKDIIMQGFYEGSDTLDLLIPFQDASKLVQDYMKRMQNEAVKLNAEKERKKIEDQFSEWKIENEIFLKSNANKTGVKSTKTGLQYSIIKEGSGDSPTINDKIKVHFKSFRINGEEIDNSYSQKPYEFKIKGSMKGLEEGFQLMSKGAKYKFFIPQYLGYGSSQKIPKVKPFSTLIYEVELLDILK